MGDGEVVEFDTPANLLRTPSSALYKMVHDTGASNAKLLTQLALDAERGIKISAQLLQTVAALAPDAVQAGLASPSMVDPAPHAQRLTEDEEARSVAALDNESSEPSALRWHAAPEEVEAVDAMAAATAIAEAMAR
jgi:hypothetical protein